LGFGATFRFLGGSVGGKWMDGWMDDDMLRYAILRAKVQQKSTNSSKNLPCNSVWMSSLRTFHTPKSRICYHALSLQKTLTLNKRAPGVYFWLALHCYIFSFENFIELYILLLVLCDDGRGTFFPFFWGGGGNQVLSFVSFCLG
jgi:hypothetical protein